MRWKNKAMPAPATSIASAKTNRMTAIPPPPKDGQPIDWQRVIDEQKAAAIRERARKFIESRKAKTNAPQEVIQQEGVQGERPGGSPGGEAGEAGGGNRPLGEAPGGAPGRQAPGVGADTYLRGFSGKYRILDTLSDGHLIVQSLAGQLGGEIALPRPGESATRLAFSA